MKNKNRTCTAYILIFKVGNYAMTLTQSEPSTRRSTLLLHRNHV